MTNGDAKAMLSALDKAGMRNVRIKDVEEIGKIRKRIDAGEGTFLKETKILMRAYRRAYA